VPNCLRQSSNRQRGSVSSRVPIMHRTDTQGTSPGRIRASSTISAADGDGTKVNINYPVEPRSNVAILPPVLTKVADKDPLSWITFTENSIMTSCKSGGF